MGTFSDWANQFTTTANNLTNTVLAYKAGTAGITNAATQPVQNGYIPQMPANVGGINTNTLLMVAAVGIIGLVLYKKFAK